MAKIRKQEPDVAETPEPIMPDEGLVAPAIDLCVKRATRVGGIGIPAREVILAGQALHTGLTPRMINRLIERGLIRAVEGEEPEALEAQESETVLTLEGLKEDWPDLVTAIRNEVLSELAAGETTKP